ncbi:hypothetical protein LAZ67_3003928, partial [Cordylochernes scorpioides]
MGDSPPPELPIALAESQVPSSTADAISTSPATEETNKPQPGTGIPSTSWADLVDRNNQIPMEEDNDGFTKVEPRRKRPVDSEAAGRKAKRGCVQAAAAKPTLTQRPAPRPKVQECTSTRQKQALFRARSAAAKVEQYVYLEFCPDFSQAQYFLALEAKLGKGSVYQLTKMEGHILVGLSSVQLADKLIEEGLDIEDATLRAFPIRKRAERIVLGNIFLFVEDTDLVAALRPYGQVTSISQKLMQLEDSCWADARREAFITLRDGVKLSQIPARLDVKSKGMVTHVYVTYGIKCSLCFKQGHKRANCPRKTGIQEDKLVLPVDAPAARAQAWTKPPSTSNVPPVAASPPPAAAVVAEPPLSDTAMTDNLDDSAPTPSETLSISQEPPSAKDRRLLAEKQMEDLLKNKKVSAAITSVQKLGLEREDLLQALTHNERCRQLQIIAALAREEGAWILGDLNISEESAKDLASGSAEALAELLDQADLVDVATFFDAALEHTRVATIGSRVDARRLDRFLLPSGFCDRVTQYQTVDYAYSDHRAVLIQVGDPAPTRLPCIGKLLRSDLFVDRMETFIDEISVDLANLSPPMLWEKWTRIKANLVAEIRSLAPAVAESGGGYIERASLFLRRRLEDDTARSDYPSLSDLGRSLRARRRSPSTFTDDDGNAISGGQLRRFLLERLSSRFAQAPSSEEAIADFLAEVTPLEFDEWDQLFLADISRDQIAAVIHRLPNGRASGWDGLPCEFVKAFEDFFAEVLWQVFEASRIRGALPPSSRRSKVFLLPKVHGGPGLQAFRPISLPTTDYRVLSGVLMARLRRHLPDLVPQCQTYAVPGRSSSWNIARVSDEAAGASRYDTPLAVISLDLKSAFDTLSRSYLFALLEKLGLPSTFLGWIAVLYGEADASIRVGDVYTKAFPLLNGVRQGCRLSASLFSIGVGPLLRRLERTLGRGNVVAYADDIVLFIRDDAQFELVPLIFEEFRMSSGVAVNFKKSCGLWCGSWKHRTDSPLGISWTSESLTVLGCTITTRNTVASQASHLMGLLERAIARWSPFTRGLSLVGRARVANSLVLGSILHHLHGYLPPETTIGRLQARLARFVWVSDGGVSLLDIAGQLRLACLKGVQASLRGAANGYSWLVRSWAWLTPPAPDVWHSPRRRRLLSLWEAASSVLELDHRVLHPATLRSLRLRGDNRFLRPPDLLAPERWLQATVGDFSDVAPALARSTRAALLDAQHLGAFCQRLLRENASSSYHAEYEAETIVLRGSATPITRLPSQRARRALDSARLQAHPTAELAARWTPTVDVPRSIPWADLRRNCFSGHDADVALRLALHALPRPDHPASRRAACGSSDGSLAHRYWSCRAVRTLLREVFAFCDLPLDLQAWLFGVGLHPEAVKLTSVAKATIYKYHLGLELVLAESQEDGEDDGVTPIQELATNTERSAEEHLALSTARKTTSGDAPSGSAQGQPRVTGASSSAGAVETADVSANRAQNRYVNSSTKNGSDANRAAETIDKNVNWADQVEAADKDEDPTPFIQVKKRKASPPKSQPTKVAKSESSAPKPAGNTRVFNRNPVAAIKNTRQQQQINKARSAAASFDQGCFIEWCSDFDHLCYMRALEEKLGRGSVFQLMRMSGHMLASLSSVEKTERLIEDGLTIGDTILRAFPYRKRAEKIIIGNLPIAVKEEDIVATLRPYCRVVSLAFEIVNCEGYSWATGNREAFILMNDGMKLHQLPGKVDIKSKGETTPAFITHGVKCSMCHRQGHRRASCPKRDREERPTNQQTPRQDPARLPPTTQTPSSAALAVTPPAALGRPQETPSKSVSAPAASTPVQPTPATSAAKSPAEGVSFSSKVSEAKLAVLTPPLPSVPRVQEESSREEETPKKASLALEQLKPVLERLPDTIFKDIEMAGVGRGRHAVDVAFVQETNVLALNNVRDLCLGYSAIFAPSSTPRGSGLAVILAPGVTVLWHRVLWPGKIAIASVKIRGLETRVINCHLSHTPEERHLQLQIIAEEAIREDAWALGDINISEESSSDIGSGAVEAFAELLDRTALVDIAAIFDAAHLPTRVASCGSRVDAARLDRVLIPSRLSGRVTRYWTLNYRNSDHRAILLQVGDPPSPSAPSISALLRSAPVIERIEALLSEASQEIEGNPTGDLWGKLKRELVEDIKCLYVSRVEDEDYVTRASRFLRSRLEAETVEADYPSLPELGRALRVRQHRAELTTVLNAQGNLFEGMSLRRYVFNSFRERFNGSTCSPEDIAGFLEGATECITLEDSDPLHRADISLNEVEVAISRLPQGKAAGWDGIPCELVKGFEDFFGGVIHQVLSESKLRGTLPESSRRNIICLVPKAHGGPGLSGYRPISLPTADYRIVSGVLLGRLRRHLPAIVPDCQTYAVPGRCPSWNIACGCACSAALFSIFTGPLLRHLERILGRGNVLAYADDILLLIREDWQFERVKTIFDEFRRASGVSVNFPKSKGLWCGAWRDRADSPLGISWSASSITVLGCKITSGHGTSVQENHLLGILERAISRWSPFVRGFSLVGRARAANSLVLAAVLHHLHGYLPGDATIAKLQARLTRFVWGSCHRAAWLPGGLLARPVSVGGVGLLDIRTQLQLACFKGVQAASRNGGKNAYSWLVKSGAWMTPLSSGSWLLPRRRRLLDLRGQASSILGLNHRVLPAPTLLNLPLIGACRFLATPSLRAPSRWRGVRVRDLAGPAPPPIARLTRSACEDAAALGAFCQRLVADNATSIYRERTLEEAVVLRGTATPFLRISTRTARRMLERPRLAAVPISRYLRRWAPVVDVPSTSLAFSSLRRCSFGGHAADIALRLALHALPHPGHPASSQPVCIACGSSDLSLAHRYWSCSAVRPLIREVFSIIGRPPDLQSWIFAVNLENHAITISSAAKHAIYVFFVDREMRARLCCPRWEEGLTPETAWDKLYALLSLAATKLEWEVGTDVFSPGLGPEVQWSRVAAFLHRRPHLALPGPPPATTASNPEPDSLEDWPPQRQICSFNSQAAQPCDENGFIRLAAVQGQVQGQSKMVETRSGKMQDTSEERIKAEESAKPQPGATIGRDASSDPVVLNPNIDIPKYDGTEDPRPWIESLEEIGFLYHWADYIISRYAAMNMIGSAKTWLNLHKISFTSWENFKSRLIEDFASDANKEEIKMRLNRMQQWNEPAIRFAEDILVLWNKVDPQMEEETKINWVIGGLKKEYSFALLLNPPKNTNELLEICKKLDLFEKNYQERAEKSKALYNGPCSPRPHHQEQWKNATSFRRPYQNTSKPQAPAPRYYQNTSKPQAPTPRYYQNKPLPQVSAPRRSYTPNPEPKPVYPSKTYNKNSNRNRTEDGRPICFKCNKPGHVARYCRVKFVRIVEEDPSVSQDKSQENLQMDERKDYTRPRLYADV